jgi:hypothetical protein
MVLVTRSTPLMRPICTRSMSGPQTSMQNVLCTFITISYSLCIAEYLDLNGNLRRGRGPFIADIPRSAFVSLCTRYVVYNSSSNTFRYLNLDTMRFTLGPPHPFMSFHPLNSSVTPNGFHINGGMDDASPSSVLRVHVADMRTGAIVRTYKIAMPEKVEPVITPHETRDGTPCGGGRLRDSERFLFQIIGDTLWIYATHGRRQYRCKGIGKRTGLPPILADAPSAFSPSHGREDKVEEKKQKGCYIS